ncbi:MAG TPA: hypothetical protein VFU81_01510, partial [Thermomicrobiales bacterium]|nr:hypothetical protein [Thermomicrobiales bacterium]
MASREVETMTRRIIVLARGGLTTRTIASLGMPRGRRPRRRLTRRAGGPYHPSRPDHRAGLPLEAARRTSEMTSARRTVVFFPEGAFGPTNNCIGIAEHLQRLGHRAVFVVEESFAGTLAARGFEERTMRLQPPPDVPEEPGQFWKD